MVERINIKSIENAFHNWDDNPKDAVWLQKSEKYIKKLIDKKINQVQLSSYLGSIYLKQEKFSKAKKEFEKCVELTKNQQLKEKYIIDVIVTIMHIANQKINNRNKDFETDCHEAINLLQILRKMSGHYNFQTLQMVEFFYSKIIGKGINPEKEKREKILVDLCFLLDIPEISLNFDFQFKILNSIKYYDFESCWVHIVKHSWDYRHKLKWNQFVRDYLDSFESTFWNEIYNKSQNKELLKLEVWAEYIFALDNITRLYLEKGEEAREELAKLKDVISNKIPSSEDKLISENSYAVKQEFMTRYVKHSTIRVEKIMRECQQSDEIWYSTIKEALTYWKLCFAYQDRDLMNELQYLDDKTVKASYHESLLEDITKKIKHSNLLKKSMIGMPSLSSISLSSLPSLESLNNSLDANSKLMGINLEDNEKISFQQSLGVCERLSDSFYHLISYVLCYDLVWLLQPPIESQDKEKRDFKEEEVILSTNPSNIPIIIDEQETRIFIFKNSHLDLVYNKLMQYDEFDDFQFPLENYFNTDIYIIHDPWNLNKILNICMWHMYDGTFHKYLRYLFPNIPEYLNLSYLNNQNTITLEDITCFFLILIIQRHINCSHNKNFFKSNVSVGQTFFLSVIQHPVASIPERIIKFWYSLVATYGREKYKYMFSDIYSPDNIYKIILEIRGEYNTYDKKFIKYIWGLLGLHLMDVFMETEIIDHSVEALHYMSLYLNSANEENIMGIKSSSNKHSDPSSVLFNEIYDASELCGRDFYEFVLNKYKVLKEKKCTRYETLIKNNQTLLNTYINDFDFLSDLEEGQGLMMTTTTSLLSLPYSEYTNDDVNETNDNEGIDGEGNETLVKSNLSANTSPSSSPYPSSSSNKNLDDILHQGRFSGNARLSRQLKLLQSTKQKEHLTTETKNESFKPFFASKPQNVPIFSSSFVVDTTTKNKGKFEAGGDIKEEGEGSFINNSSFSVISDNKFEDRVKENSYINDIIGNNLKINNDHNDHNNHHNHNNNNDDDNDNDNDNNNNNGFMKHSNSNVFNNMRESSGYIDDILINSDSESSENSEEDIIEKLSRKQKQNEQRQKQQQQHQHHFNATLISNAEANASISDALNSYKSMISKNSNNNSNTSLSGINKRLSRQLGLLNSIKK